MTDSLSLRDKRMNQVIELHTEPEERVAGFIMGNAICHTCRKLTPPDENVGTLLRARCDCDPPIRPGRHPVVVAGEAAGKELAICGAGPSLSAFRTWLTKFRGDIWGANRGLNYLRQWGINQSLGVAIDTSTGMFGEVWNPVPVGGYLLATSVNPGLVWAIEQSGSGIRYFHSFRGAEGEVPLYRLLYPDTVLAVRGLNVVNRALDVAEYMGYRRIHLLGADNCLGSDGAFYAGGEKARNEEDITLEGEIDGRLFRTKTDMLMSAVELVRKRNELKAAGVEVIFHGRTLPKALESKPESFLRRCIDWQERQ